jgi:hypothetical protein
MSESGKWASIKRLKGENGTEKISQKNLIISLISLTRNFNSIQLFTRILSEKALK